MKKLELDSKNVTIIQVLFYLLIILSTINFNFLIESIINASVLVSIGFLNFLSLSFIKDEFVLDINSCDKSLLDPYIIFILNIFTFIALSIEFSIFVSFIYLISISTFYKIRRTGLMVREC